MIRVKDSVVIDRPLDNVFQYMARFENDKQWRTELADIRATAPGISPGVGDRYEQLLQWGDRQVQADFEVVEFETDRHIGFRGTAGDVRARGWYDFEPHDGQTRVDVGGEVEISGALSITEPFVERVLRDQGTEDLHRLKDILETSR